MPNQNILLYPPLTFRILAITILACLSFAPRVMADTKNQEYIIFISSSTFREKWAYDLLEAVEKTFSGRFIQGIFGSPYRLASS